MQIFNEFDLHFARYCSIVGDSLFGSYDTYLGKIVRELVLGRGGLQDIEMPADAVAPYVSGDLQI